jgi:CBS domain-containing protein
MKRLPFRLGDRHRRAVVDTVDSLLERKGHDVLSIPPTATVFEAIAEMARNDVSALAVVAAGELVGIVTERDYARKVILRGRASRETPLSEIMTPWPVTVTPRHTVDDCLRIMTVWQIRHLPVVEHGELRGMVSIGDLVKTIISSQSYTIDQLYTYIGSGYFS